MKSFRIYLAGAMSGITYAQSNEWRVYFKTTLEEMYAKVFCFNPNDYYKCEEDVPQEIEVEAMRFDLHNLRNSNLVICNMNHPESLGTMTEIAIAYERRIPILMLNENNKTLHPWQIAMADKVFDSREDLMMYVCKYYLDKKYN